MSFSLAPRGDSVDDVNSAPFVDGQNRGVNFNLVGVTKETMEAFTHAPRVKVTIEVIE